MHMSENIAPSGKRPPGMHLEKQGMVRIFGIEKLLDWLLVVAMFIRLTNTGEALRSTLWRT